MLVDLEDRVNSDALIHEKYPGLLDRDVQGWEMTPLLANPDEQASTPQRLEEAVSAVTKADVQQVR